jgi:hypothetical protein
MIKLKTRSVTVLTDDEVKLVSGGRDTDEHGDGNNTSWFCHSDGCTSNFCMSHECDSNLCASQGHCDSDQCTSFCDYPETQAGCESHECGGG